MFLILKRFPIIQMELLKKKNSKNFNEFVIAGNRTYVFEGSTTVSLNGSEILYIELEQPEN